jgi:glycosyltransferase involved in cell wall biosynthesis
MRALALQYPDVSLTLFTSSWKDRPDPALASAIPRARVSDHRFPVSALNFAWHRLEWPPVEEIVQGRYDIAFSPHPLLMPARHAAQLVMVHDLDFLRHPERTEREIRRDYPRLAESHARRAARVIVPSPHTADETVDRLGVARDRVVVCPPGVPDWREPIAGRPPANGYVLFVGTLERRKNIDGLLDAYARVLARHPTAPKLVLAGSAGAEAQPWLDAIARPPLAGHVEHLGYVRDVDRQRVYAGARVLVMPSFDEGFGMPALEAMSLGIPVIAARRGNLPDLVGDAGILVEPDDVESIDAALDRMLREERAAELAGKRGLERSQPFRWQYTATALHDAFRAAGAAPAGARG